ncbi:MAG: arylesterase [Pseudomonadota bacterium]|nr:arylesterase [Pseudomonadota bacterium]MDP1905061.1 arylesterase [Pseudomonadota bacterium]MDP2351179.1 arylesterase [Pseudomonadota bacterium]
MSMRIKVFCLLLLLCGPVLAAPTVLVFGDSLSAAYGIPRESGWVSLLEKRLPGYKLVNASVSGETTAGGLTRLPQVLAAHRPEIVILELGANDGLRGLSLRQTKRNLETMVDMAEKHGGRVLLVGMRLPPNYGQAYTRKFQALFVDVAKSRDVRLLPFLLEGMAERRDRFLADGLHPDAAAQPLLLDNVWRELKPMLKEK